MAIVVSVALHVGLGTHAPALVGVALGTAGALAFVASGLVDTDGSALAGVEQALVDILTPSQWIAGVTRLAKTLRGVGGRALGVVTAAVALARALAAVSVKVVHVEGRGAKADSALALFVLLAVGRGGTGRPDGSADSVLGVASESVGARAGVGSGQVGAHGPVSAGRGTNGTALINVYTLVLAIHGVTLRARAVGDSAGDLDALGGSVALSAASQLTTAVDFLVRRQTSAVASLTGLAANEGVASERGRTLAVVGAGKILADGVDTAGGQACQALVDVNAVSGVGIQVEAATANAPLAEAGLSAVAVGVAGALEGVVTLAGLVGVAGGAGGTLALEGADRILAHGLVAAGVGRGALVDVRAGAAVGAELETRQTAAEGFAVLHEALRVGEAGGAVAGVWK